MGRSEFVMIKGDSEGKGMNRDTKVTIDMPGDETKLLMESHVSYCTMEQHDRSQLHSASISAWRTILIFYRTILLKLCIWQHRTLD